jgi:hypothetical protein
MAETPESNSETPERKAAAAEMAREANTHIREMAEALDSIVPDERPIGFFCECGCMGTVSVTLTDYEAQGGAWIEGHGPR